MITILFYNIIFFGVALWAYFAEYAISYKQRALCRVLCFFILFVPAALRYDIGTDYSFYVDAYNSKEALANYECGFKFIVNLLNYFGFEPQSLFVFTSFLIYAPICFLFKKEGYFLKLILYFLIFYLYSFNVIRNSIALSFLLIALEDYFLKSKLRAYIIYALACTFHYSMLFFIPLFIFDFIHLNRKCIIIVFTLIFYVVYTNSIFHLLNTPLFLDSKYGIYIGSVHSNETDIGSGFGVLLFLLIPALVLGALLINYDIKRRMLLYMLFSYIISFILALKIQIFGRLSDLFSTSLVCTIPYMMKSFNVQLKYIRYIGYLSCLLLFLLFQLQIINNKKNNISGGHGINPYETIMH